MMESLVRCCFTGELQRQRTSIGIRLDCSSKDEKIDSA